MKNEIRRPFSILVLSMGVGGEPIFDSVFNISDTSNTTTVTVAAGGTFVATASGDLECNQSDL